MNNYEFCVQWIIDKQSSVDHPVSVLDYGCGAGAIVKALRERGYDAFGCDVFYEGGDYSQRIEDGLFSQGTVRRMDEHGIPFEDSSFDFVVNNQVMEHVIDLNGVLGEISRVLKPGGSVLSLFPDKGVWREGHCGIPFLHWFAKRSVPRIYYAAALRFVGLGYHKGGKSVLKWSEDFCDWLDNWTYYRSAIEINTTYARHFCDVRHIETLYLEKRLGERAYIARVIPASVQQLIVNKWASAVFVARKASV